MSDAYRRLLLQTGIWAASGLAIRRIAHAAEPTVELDSLTRWLGHPLLIRTLYRHAVSNQYATDGAAGVNIRGYQWIEEQRQGAEWIVRGFAEGKPDWIELGWRELDWGLAHQQPDGGFASQDAFHSTAFFVEALARSCLVDRSGVIDKRIVGLRRAADWLMNPAVEVSGASHNQPFTHRRYILTAAFGQTAVVTHDRRFADKALHWLDQGLALQENDGTNPERGGFDAGYQMVGVLMALRYLPTCPSAKSKTKIEVMVRRAISRELLQQQADGRIDATGSTRIEKEMARNGMTKEVPYAEILQALVFASQAFEDAAWLDAAEKIAVLRGW